jgi:S1-C subfamily serine protease
VANPAVRPNLGPVPVTPRVNPFLPHNLGPLPATPVVRPAPKVVGNGNTIDVTRRPVTVNTPSAGRTVVVTPVVRTGYGTPVVTSVPVVTPVATPVVTPVGYPVPQPVAYPVAYPVAVPGASFPSPSVDREEGLPLDFTAGVRIVKLFEGWTAERQGLREGDVILTVAEAPTTTPEELVAAVKNAGARAKVVYLSVTSGKTKTAALAPKSGKIGVEVEAVTLE